MGKAVDIHQNLIEGCRKNESRAQVAIYDRYHKAMYNTAFRFVKDQFRAEDIMQEAFLQAFTNIHQYREEASFGSWLKRIVVNRSINDIKAQKEWLQFTDEPLPASEELEQEVELPLCDIQLIKEAISALAPKFQMVLSLYLLEGYDHEEIAQILGISTSTSRSQLSRAKSRLQQLLSNRKTNHHV